MQTQTGRAAWRSPLSATAPGKDRTLLRTMREHEVKRSVSPELSSTKADTQKPNPAWDRPCSSTEHLPPGQLEMLNILEAKTVRRQFLRACSSGPAGAAVAFALFSLCQAGTGSACGNRSLLQKYPWGKQVTLSPVLCSLPDLWMATNPLALQD